MLRLSLSRSSQLLLLLSALLLSSIAEAAQPNIAMVFIDDLGWTDLSCFGGQRVETPAIDRLATEGIRFTQFYVNSPICSPSRTALSTGQYPQRWQISSFLAEREMNRRRGMQQWLDPQAPLLARALHEAGYATGHFGKWHMGGQRDVGEAPLITEYGFDASLTNFEGLGPRVLPLLDRFDGTPPKKYDLGSANLGHGPIRWIDRSRVTQTYVERAVQFIQHAHAAGQPFYVNLWPDDVHSPFFPPEEQSKQAGQRKRRRYFAVLKAMDRQLAPLFGLLRAEPVLRDNTLVILASDNGPEPGAGLSIPLRGVKGQLYEGGTRSPLVVWGPGLFAPNAAGTTNERSVLCALDINRSLYSLTETSLPEGTVLDGEDFSQTLLGHEQQTRANPIFWRRPPDRPGPNESPLPDLALRSGNWKFYISYNGTRAELYDLAADVSETHNIANQHPDLVTQFRDQLLTWNTTLPRDAGDPSWEH